MSVMEKQPADAAPGECCNFDCAQGRHCPRRLEAGQDPRPKRGQDRRERQPSLFGRWLEQLLQLVRREKRSGFDRRQRQDPGPFWGLD
jgi:hypothetical protein